MIKSVTIKNYKAFGLESSTLQLRPVTILVGKNNSGKSSILKLLSILATMSKGSSLGPIVLKNDSVSLGGRYQDLFHNNDTSSMTLQLEYADGKTLEFLYLMNEGELYNKFSLPISENNGQSALVISQDNPFKPYIKNIVSSQEDTKNPYSFTADYIGPLRHTTKRNIQISGNDNKSLVADGQNVCEILLGSFNSDKKLFRLVADWLEKNLDCPGLSFERNSESSGSYSLSVRHGDAIVNLADVGQGISQVLPLIVSSYMDNYSDLTIIEQPVLHIHPAAHQSVAVRIAESAKEMKRTFVLETHSYNFILALRDMVSDPSNSITPEDVIIYSVEQDDNESWLKQITIDRFGELSDWPEGVFSESYELLKSIKSHSYNSVPK